MSKAKSKSAAKTISEVAVEVAPVVEDALLADGLDEIEALLAGADDGEEVVVEELESAEVIEDDVTVESEDELEKLEASIEAEEDKRSAYEEQKDEGTVVVEAIEASKKARVPRTRSASTAGESVLLKCGEKASDTMILVTADVDRDFSEVSAEIVTIVNGMAKKVGEKAVNMFNHIANGQGLSAYTKIGLDVLSKAEEPINALTIYNEMISADNVAGKSYAVGTAKSQSHQMTQLFNALKITKPEGKGIVVNPNSVLASALLP